MPDIGETWETSERQRIPALTRFERTILNHRLAAPDAIDDALADTPGINRDNIATVAALCIDGRFDDAFNIDASTTRAVLIDAIDGSTYYGASRSQSNQMRTAIYQTGCSLARKIGNAMGVRIDYPDY